MSTVELKKVNGINGTYDSKGTNGTVSPDEISPEDDVEVKSGKEKKKEPMTGVFEVVGLNPLKKIHKNIFSLLS